MRFCLSLLLFFGCLSVSVTTTADDAASPQYDFMVGNTPLGSDELRAAFLGQTHVGFYRFDSANIPTRNFSETTFKNGRVEHTQGDEVLTGQWIIAKNQICFTYDNVWQNQLCFDMYRVGNCYYHYLATQGQRPMKLWTARSSLKGESPDCEPNIA